MSVARTTNRDRDHLRDTRDLGVETEPAASIDSTRPPSVPLRAFLFGRLQCQQHDQQHCQHDEESRRTYA